MIFALDLALWGYDILVCREVLQYKGIKRVYRLSPLSTREQRRTEELANRWQLTHFKGVRSLFEVAKIRTMMHIDQHKCFVFNDHCSLIIIPPLEQ